MKPHHSPKTIDIHTHILPEHLPDWAVTYGNPRYVALEHHKPCCARMLQGGKVFREITHNSWDGPERIRECDRDGVDIQVLSTIPVLFHYWAPAQQADDTSRFLNDHIAETCAAHPDRFIGIGTLPLQDPVRAIIELERCVKDLGMAGVEIGSHVNDWNLNAAELFPVFEAAERLGACIFVHPWDMMGMDKMPNYWLPWLVGMPAETSLAICSMLFGGVFERLPKLRVAFAHGGGSFPVTLGRIEHGFNVRPDLVAVDNPVAPREYMGRFWLDSLVHDPLMLKHLVHLVGHQRVAVGSDYPFPLGEHIPGKLIKDAGFAEDVKEWLLEKSAMAWLYGEGV